MNWWEWSILSFILGAFTVIGVTFIGVQFAFKHPEKVLQPIMHRMMASK